MQMRRAERRRNFGRRWATVAATVALTSGAFALAASPGAATTPAPDALGHVVAITTVPGGVHFTGWAVDPAAPTANATVTVIIDGRTRTTSVPTSLPDAAVATKYHSGPTPDFSISSPVPTGAHTVCAVVLTIGTGLHRVMRCVTTPLTTPLTAAQVAAHKPVGAISAASAATSSVRFQGWASDPDFVSLRSTVVLYLDGSPAATVVTHYYPPPRPVAAGYRSAYDITVAASTGTHIGCIWVVNVGLGSGNTFLGCRGVDTRGVPLTGPPPATPAINPLVLAEAKKHIGQSYVFGATGPSTFDCSGLVMYSYGKAGYSTPRVSEAQSVKANLIPASRALPGDLVFTHDSEGDVFHVGIYVSPGTALAAIDEAEGVNYQTIWDPSATTYGSFTHR